jgi:hypothetical protein
VPDLSAGTFPWSRHAQGGWVEGLAASEKSCEYLLQFPLKTPSSTRLLDYLSLSRHGESSDELDSVMIIDPMTGNSLGKQE